MRKDATSDVILLLEDFKLRWQSWDDTNLSLKQLRSDQKPVKWQSFTLSFNIFLLNLDENIF